MSKELNGARTLKVTMVLLILCVLVYFGITLFMGETITGNEEKTIVETSVLIKNADITQSQVYTTGKDGFYFVTKDGLSFNSFKGVQVYSDPLNLNQPLIYGEGGIVAVSEHKGTSLHVYNKDGKMYSKTFEYPVINFSLNKIGSSIVILKKDDTDAYIMYVYDENGEQKNTGNISEANVIPVAAELSDDGKRCFISYVDYNKENINSIVTYYYNTDTEVLGDSLSNSDGEYASNVKNQNELIFVLKVIDDKHMIIVSDKDITCVNFEDPSTPVWEIALTNELTQISFNEDKGFAIALGKGFINQAAEPVGTVMYYDSNQNLLWTHGTNEEVTYLNFNLGTLLVGVRNSFAAMNVKGDVLWNYNSLSNVNNIFFVGNSSTVIEASEMKVSLFAAGKKTDHTESAEPVIDGSASDETVVEDNAIEPEPTDSVEHEDIPPETTEASQTETLSEDTNEENIESEGTADEE